MIFFFKKKYHFVQCSYIKNVTYTGFSFLAYPLNFMIIYASGDAHHEQQTKVRYDMKIREVWGNIENQISLPLDISK